MKSFLFIILLIGVVIHPGESYAVSCPVAPQPKLNFSMKKTQTKFDFSKDVSTLTRENGTASSLGVGWVNEGIMSTKFPNYQISAKVNGVKFPQINKACYWVEEVTFLWVFSPTINVAKEYKKGSCKYNTIIAHERQHVEIDIKVLLRYKDFMKKTLAKVTSSPISTGLVNINNDINLLAYVENKIKPVVSKMVKERTYKQGKIDTAEEYKKLGAKCK